MGVNRALVGVGVAETPGRLSFAPLSAQTVLYALRAGRRRRQPASSLRAAHTDMSQLTEDNLRKLGGPSREEQESASSRRCRPSPNCLPRWRVRSRC